MKKTIKLFALLIALCMVLTLVFAACKPTTPPEDDNPDDPTPGTSTANTFMSLTNYKAYIKSELGDYYALFDSIKSNTTVYGEVTKAYNSGLSAIDAATSVADVQAASTSAKNAMAKCIPYANDVFDYTGLSADERTEILGLLEAYAYRTGSSGLVMFEDSAYVMYNERVTLGTEHYIPGYGFGTLAEGSITAPLDSESKTEWKNYYHSANSKDPGDANYLDAQGSAIGTFYGYISASYYTVFMNEAKDGYVWVPELADGDVEPYFGEEDLNEAGQTDVWCFKIRDGLQYSTLGSRTEYNGRYVQPEDFITPFKLLLNQANNYYRGNEMSKSSGASYIEGAKEYYSATAGANKGIETGVNFDDYVGVWVEEDEETGDWYFCYQLGAKVNAWYARYYISSSLYMPIPADFIEEVGVDNYLRFSSDTSTSPVDNSLSLGAYTLEAWDDGQQIVYKKNQNYVYAKSKYSIEGVHINIVEAAQTDENAIFREFLAGNIDAAAIPSDYLQQYSSDERTRKSNGSATFKLNYNALDQDTWNALFGENGTVTQSADNTWIVEPALSNAHFRSALSYAFNRDEFAKSKGMTGSLDFFSDEYMSDPENGIVYNSTDAHKKAVAGFTNEMTDKYGYSLELAREYFKMALDELEASGKYTRGTKTNPTEIKIEVAWFTSSDENAYHKYVKQYWESAFNDDSVHGGCYKLTIEFWCPPDNDYNKTYDRMMEGTFDIAFGTISGVEMDPLGFMNSISTDMSLSHNFTLNWSKDTNDPDAELIIFNGMRWSYDALYQVTQQESQILEGALNNTNPKLGDYEFEYDAESDSFTATLSFTKQSIVKIEKVDFVLFGYTDAGVYSEWSILQYVDGDPVVEGDTYTYTLVIPMNEFASLFYIDSGDVGIDLYLSYSVPSLGIGATDLNFIGTYYIDILEIVEEDYDVDEDGTVTAQITVGLIDGFTADDLYLEIFGVFDYGDEELDYGNVELTDYIDDVVENDDGTITIIFVIPADAYEGLVGGKYAAAQSIDCYLVIGDVFGLIGSLSFTFVE